MEPPVFARYNFGDIVLTDEERAAHLIGRSGTGKSTLLYNLALADILTINHDTDRPRGLAVIDPHGDLIDALLDTIPPNRTNDVIVVDATDREYAVGFDPMANNGIHERHLAAVGIVEAFRGLFADAWSSRIETFFTHGVRLLLDTDRPTLYDLSRIYDDADFRDAALRRVTDPRTKVFWTTDYPSYPERYREEAAGPVKQRVDLAITSPPVRGILCQRHPRLDVGKALALGKIVFLKLNGIGRQPANLLGSLFISHLHQRAMARPAHQRSIPRSGKAASGSQTAQMLPNSTVHQIIDPAYRYNSRVAAAQRSRHIAGHFDYTMWYGVELYRMWKKEWSREKPLDSLVGKARMCCRYARTSPAEARLFGLFGVDWRHGDFRRDGSQARFQRKGS
jgi:hypothetical protein